GGCGYDLRAAASDRCPECGRRFDLGHLVHDLVPWEQRKHIGRLRAFVSTALLATFRPRRLADKMIWPISRTAARAFWFCTMLLAAVAITLIAYVISQQFPELLRPQKTSLYDFRLDVRWLLLL